MDPGVKICGVILNRVAGSRHESVARGSIEQLLRSPRGGRHTQARARIRDPLPASRAGDTTRKSVTWTGLSSASAPWPRSTSIWTVFSRWLIKRPSFPAPDPARPLFEFSSSDEATTAGTGTPVTGTTGPGTNGSGTAGIRQSGPEIGPDREARSTSAI